eukprot:TRINITY_DN23054_c0_g1_i1.p1 TRINITY_DN23054_c0_g1~~TRINITY_DN23054_c0_g1_i1.p1  ORF type:complete len:103 (+),score=8.78 TRINITY_DN23054_c0_g1_i1:200-508(+)
MLTKSFASLYRYPSFHCARIFQTQFHPRTLQSLFQIVSILQIFLHWLCKFIETSSLQSNPHKQKSVSVPASQGSSTSRSNALHLVGNTLSVLNSCHLHSTQH